MSDMDGVSDVKDIIKRAMKWGHTGTCYHRSRMMYRLFRMQTMPLERMMILKSFMVVEAYLVDDLKGAGRKPDGAEPLHDSICCI